jgi:replicative DNA helicase
VSTEPPFSETRSALFDLLRDVNAGLYSEATDAALLADLIGRTRELADATATDPAAIAPAPSQLADVLADIERRRAHYADTGSSIMGHSTGMAPLDDLLGGLEAGRVTTMLAAPAAGKTTLANQLAWTIASAGVPVLYVSFENETSDLIKKTIARLAGVNPAFIDRGLIDPEQLTDALETFRARGSSLYYLSGTASTTIEAIRAALIAITNRHPGAGHPLVIVDYLQQLARITGTGREDIRVRVGMVSRGLTDLAKAYGAHIWAISSMNRESYRNGKSEAGMASGKESGDIEFDAAHVLTLTPGTEQQAPDANTDALTLKVAKNRYGRTGAVELHRDKATLRIAPANGPRLVHPNGSARDRV